MKVFKWFLRSGGVGCLIVAAVSNGKIPLIADIVAAMMFSMAIGIYVGERSKSRKK